MVQDGIWFPSAEWALYTLRGMMPGALGERDENNLSALMGRSDPATTQFLDDPMMYEYDKAVGRFAHQREQVRLIPNACSKCHDMGCYNRCMNRLFLRSENCDTWRAISTRHVAVGARRSGLGT